MVQLEFNTQPNMSFNAAVFMFEINEAVFRVVKQELNRNHITLPHVHVSLFQHEEVHSNPILFIYSINKCKNRTVPAFNFLIAS